MDGWWYSVFEEVKLRGRGDFESGDCLFRLPASPVHSEQVRLRAAVFVHPEEPLSIKPVSAQRCTLYVQFQLEMSAL